MAISPIPHLVKKYVKDFMQDMPTGWHSPFPIRLRVDKYDDTGITAHYPAHAEVVDFAFLHHKLGVPVLKAQVSGPVFPLALDFGQQFVLRHLSLSYLT